MSCNCGENSHNSTVRLLYSRSHGWKNLRQPASIFGLLFGPKLLINAKILINAETSDPRVANWPPKFNGIHFPALGPIQCHKVQHLLVTLGGLKRFFSSSALTPSVKALGSDFNFCTDRNAWFGLNIGPDS